MKNKLFCFFLFFTGSFFILFHNGCSSTKYPYDYSVEMIVDYNLRNNYEILPIIPSGWFVAEDESVPENIAILLLEKKYRAAIILGEIKISKNARDIITKKGLEELATMSFEMKKDASKDSLILCSELNKYKFDDREFISYHYKPLGTNDTACVIVFKTPANYYELSSVYLKTENQKYFTPRDSLLSIHYNVLKNLIK